MKKFLTLIAAVFMAVGANAADIQLSLDELGSGWKSSYDSATKTITYNEGWAGRGWSFGSVSWGSTPLDLSLYDKVVVEYDGPSAIGAQVVVCYDETSVTSSAGAQAGATEVVVNLNPDYKNKVTQVYIQSYAQGTLKLKNAYIHEEELGNKVLKVSSSAVQSNTWDSSVTISLPSGIEAGKKYTVTMDVKADAATTIGTEFIQNGHSCKDQYDGSAMFEYAAALNATSEWTTVTTSFTGKVGSNAATCETHKIIHAGEDYLANAVLLTFGKFKGSFEIDNVKVINEDGEVVYTENFERGIDNVSAPGWHGHVSIARVVDESVPVYADTPVEIAFDSKSGFVNANQFDGLSLDAMVKLTFKTVGSNGYVNWGATCLASDQNQNAEGVVKYPAGNQAFNILGEGDNTVTFKLSDIVDILNTCCNPETGKYGAYWDIWGFGDGACKNTRVGIKVYDCTNSEAEKFTATYTVSIATNAAGVASFYTENDALDFTSVEGLTAYVAKSVTDDQIELEAVESVPEGTAFVVKGEPSKTYYVKLSNDPKSINTNEFLGTSSEYTVAGNETIYALNSDGRFQKVATGVNVPTGKAVIRVSKSSAKDVLTLNFGDATAINAIQTVNTVNANAYNIAGQRVNSDAKGIVIVNGRKFINK